MFDFLTLPERTPKPRESGLTHVLDKGYSLDQVRQFLEVAQRLRRHRQAGLGHGGRDAEPEGEDRALPELRHPRLLRRHLLRGLPAAEQARGVPRRRARVSAWTASRSQTAPSTWRRTTSSRSCDVSAKEFRVLSEVGSKDASVVIAPFKWVDSIKRELEAGAWKVITEGRESGTVGHLPARRRGQGGPARRASVAAVDPENLLFEAPIKSQQAWFVKQFGANVNLGNIPPEEVHLGRDAARRRARRHAAAFPLSGSQRPCLLLVRHGETDWNREPARCQGWARDRPERDGPRTGARPGSRARGRGLELIVTSHLSARAQTAELDRDELGGDVPAHHRPAAGRDPPRRLGGAAVREIMTRSRRPGGSTASTPRTSASPAARASPTSSVACWPRCATSRGTAGESLLVTHGGSIRLVRCFLDGRGIAAFHETRTSNGGVDEIETAGLANASRRCWAGAPDGGPPVPLSSRRLR